MPYHEFFWTRRALEKIEDNGLTALDVEHAVLNSWYTEISRRSGRDCYVGPAVDGRRVLVVYEEFDPVTLLVITAYVIGDS